MLVLHHLERCLDFLSKRTPCAQPSAAVSFPVQYCRQNRILQEDHSHFGIFIGIRAGFIEQINRSDNDGKSKRVKE